MRLTTKLVALLAGCAVVPVVIGTLLSFASAKQALTELVNAELETGAISAVDDLQTFLQDAAIDLRTWGDLRVMRDVLIDDDDGELGRELARLRAHYPYFAELSVVNQAGITVSSSDDRRTNSDFSAHPLFMSALAGGSVQSGVRSDDFVPGPSVVIGEPIRASHDSTTVIGVLFGIVRWSAVQDLLAGAFVAGAAQDADHRLVLSDDDGERVLYHSLSRTVGAMPPEFAALPGRTGVRDVLLGEKAYVIGTAVTEEQEHIANPRWQLNAMLSSDVAYAAVDRLRDNFILFGGIVTLVVVVLGSFGARRIASPLVDIAGRMRDLAAGQGDLAAELAVSGNDEIADLSRSFNEFVGKIRGTLAKVADSSVQLYASANDLLSVVGNTNATVQQQHSETDRAAVAMQEMLSTVESVARHASATAAAGHEADQEASSGLDIVTANNESIQALVNDMESARAVVQSLEQESQNINAILGLIAEVAFQSKVLALNAAIEASSAGEHGQGFKVVSDEVRAMAGRTTEATETIRGIMNGLKSNAEKAAEAMEFGRTRAQEVMARAEQVTEVFHSISESSANISGMSNQIAVATREQVSAIGEIRLNIERIKEMGATTASGATQTASSSCDLHEQVAELDGLVAQFNIARSRYGEPAAQATG